MLGMNSTALLSLGLMLAGPAQWALGTATAHAEEHGRGWGDRGGHWGGEHHDHDGIGAGGIVLGLAAVAGVAALAASASHDGYYDRPYDVQPAYAYGYGDRGSYVDQSYYARAAANQCARAAVDEARERGGYARLGRIYDIDRHGDDAYVRGTVAVGDGYDRDDAREIGFRCKFDDGHVRSVRLDRVRYDYRGY